MINKLNFMRGEKGKLISVWSPVLHGEGCSTLACSIGFGIQHFTGKKVLVVNKSNSTSHMEKYVEKDIEIKYSMDNLKIFNTGIRSEHILTYATQVNTGLYMLAGSRLNREITKESIDFDRLFIEKCLEGFDIVVADIDTGIRAENRLYLDASDSIVAVLAPNEIIIQELFRNAEMRDVMGYFTDARTVNIINKLYEGWDSCRVIGRYNSRYSLTKTFGLNYNGDILNACCNDRNLYSFLMKEIRRRKNEYVKQLSRICEFLAGELSMEEEETESTEYGKRFRRLVRSGLFL